MEEAAVSQSIRNWKLLSDIKETAISVQVKGEEAGADFSVFSRQNLYARSQNLPAYERLINRISFIKPSKTFNSRKSNFSLIRLLAFFLFCILTALLFVMF